MHVLHMMHFNRFGIGLELNESIIYLWLLYHKVMLFVSKTSAEETLSYDI